MTAEGAAPASAGALRRGWLVPALIAAFLVVQLLVPTIALFGPRPARFGWQMYSALPDVPRAFVVEADGSEHEIDLQHLFAVQRAEIDYVAVLRTGVCDATSATAIRLVLADGESQEVSCR
ncbi:MAG TPA: hypothetical protein VHU77_08585 [Candidatus Limnocylindria bacterium]|nr:hypothetical protein [Candidatus Limnocylindria bacterium]